ncbi:SH3 domain-containing protein [Streptomyces sp. NBC_00203]|uniref:SH3 domain-containing protein n=1 Tax=Streptomyces sp. NBC_00203 TaxID=2975680 RepID=UPI0032508A89
MSLRSTYTRLGIALAAGSLVALAGATPALADDEWDPGTGDSRGSDNGFGDERSDGRDSDNGFDNDGTVRGRVDVNGGLALRNSPHRGSRLIRVARNGEIVHIYCKAWGESVNGDSLWYLLSDGTWAWGPARFIETFGSPRWC